MKQTLYTCDFSTQVGVHSAQFTIAANGKDGKEGELQLDACVDHVGRMVDTLLTERDTPAVKVMVMRHSGVTAVEVEHKQWEASSHCLS